MSNSGVSALTKLTRRTLSLPRATQQQTLRISLMVSAMVRVAHGSIKSFTCSENKPSLRASVATSRSILSRIRHLTNSFPSWAMLRENSTQMLSSKEVLLLKNGPTHGSAQPVAIYLRLNMVNNLWNMSSTKQHSILKTRLRTEFAVNQSSLQVSTITWRKSIKYILQFTVPIPFLN